MSDLVKGIVIGIIAVKIFESEPVQNAINKAIRKRVIKEAAKTLSEAVAEDNKEEKPTSGRYPWKDDGSNLDIIYDKEGHQVGYYFRRA